MCADPIGSGNTLAPRELSLVSEQFLKKKKDFTSFCQPTQPIACANYGNHVQIIMKSRQSTT